MSSYKCSNCQVQSSLDNWLITTAYLLGITVEELKTTNRDVPIFFCPICVCPAVITWEGTETDDQTKQVIIDAEIIEDREQPTENFDQNPEDNGQ